MGARPPLATFHARPVREDVSVESGAKDDADLTSREKLLCLTPAERSYAASFELRRQMAAQKKKERATSNTAAVDQKHQYPPWWKARAEARAEAAAAKLMFEPRFDEYS